MEKRPLGAYDGISREEFVIINTVCFRKHRRRIVCVSASFLFKFIWGEDLYVNNSDFCTACRLPA